MENTKDDVKFFLTRYGIKVTNWGSIKKEVLFANIIGDWNSIRSKLGLVTNVTYDMHFMALDTVDRLGNHFGRTCKQIGKGSNAEVSAAVKVIQRACRVRQGTQYMNIKAIFIFCCCFFSLQLQTFLFFVVLFLGQ